jgi:hypothetical protein
MLRAPIAILVGLALPLLLLLLLLAPPSTGGSAVTIDATNSTGRAFSLGGNLWLSPALPQPVPALGLKLLRLWDMADNSIAYPTDTTQAQMDAFAATMLNRTSARSVQAYAAEAVRANTSILLGGLIPINYQDKQTKTMAPERVQDVAHLLATLVDRLRRCAQGSTLSIQGGSLLSRIPSFRMKKSERPRTACCRDIWLNKCRFLIT